MYRPIKHFFDFFAALVGLIIFSPVILVTSVALYFLNDGLPFFFQKRPGIDKSVFRIVKFKSMNDKKDANGMLLPNEDRITSVGRFIRKTSIDEIPQLFNVLKGDMSLVGPRPLKMDYLELYSEEQNRRHEVKPGITGWAQVNGRNALSHTDKFKLDVWYVDNFNFLLDCKILTLTFIKVFKREGVGTGGVNTNIPFDGTN